MGNNGMNKEEFYHEVINSYICPDDFHEVYSQFISFQELAWETLKYFHHICENNGIRYQLAFGSLLGVIRDGGQIPWDYDVDVFVLSEDRKRLVKALSEDFSQVYYFVCAEVDDKCRNEMIRLCPKGYDSDRLHVDVFFLTGVPDDKKQCDAFVKRIRYLCRARYYRLVKIQNEYRGHNKAKVYVALQKLRYLLFDYKRAHYEYLELCDRYSVNGCKKTVNANMYAGAYFIPTEYIVDTSLVDVNGDKFRIPSRYNELLTMLYGNYMELPKLENRINEMMTSYKKLKMMEQD